VKSYCGLNIVYLFKFIVIIITDNSNAR